MRALVIDDSRAIRSMIRRILDGLGFQVAEAANGREALAALEEDSGFALAMVDWNMPEMDGLSFVRAVRADERFADLRLVMVTTETESERVVLALSEGADEYAMKPFTSEIIRDKLALLGLS